MPIIGYQRITSSPATVVSADTGANAVQSLLFGTPAPTPVNTVTNPYPLWPQLSLFNNDNSTFLMGGSASQAQAVWPHTGGIALPNERVGFGAVTNQLLLSATVPVTPLTANFSIDLNVFADNAVQVNIQAFNIVQLSPIPILAPLLLPNLNITLTDGTITNPDSENNATPPYNWQSVRHYSIATGTTTLIGLGVVFGFAFDVLNYNTNGAANPGGLAFYADIYGDVQLILP